jgi:hypothetical protein
VLEDRAHDQRRDERANRVVDVHRAELAAVDAALDGAREEPGAALDHFGVVEAGELGEVLRLRDHQLRYARVPGGADRVPPAGDQRPQEVRRLALELVDPLLGRLDRADDARADHRLEQVFLAVEVEVDRALRDARALRDVVEPRGGVAALHEEVERGVEDLARARLLAAFEAGFDSLEFRCAHGDTNN